MDELNFSAAVTEEHRRDREVGPTHTATMSVELRKTSYAGGRVSSSGMKKVYETMLLKELTGGCNQPMHAVLESSVDYDDSGGIQEAQKVRDHALIHYLASLANSNNLDDKFDFDFVESLINNGADINSTDKTGQTIFHEVARSWNLDVAAFLLDQGADLNKQDKFGRSPLHVAAAVDYAEMTEFLVKKGADINIATFGEGQMPIHYAAKNDGCRSLKMLLGYGADIDSRDSKNRTPLQVAAEMSRARAAKLLVQNGAPAGVNDHMGNSVLALLIEKLPDVAVDALDQFHSVSTINRKEYFFLNYLEGKDLKDPESQTYSALEVAVQNHEFDVILHPVMQRLILVKWQKFARQGALTDLILNLFYAILWSTLAITTPFHGNQIYLPLMANAWRLVISILICIITVDEIRKQLTGILRARRRQTKSISWKVTEMKAQLAYCHPRWPQEEMFVKSEIEAAEGTPLISAFGAWVYYDWFSLVLILATIVSHVIYLTTDSNLSHIIYLRIITVLLLVLWFRMLKYARPFEGAGPFVVIFGHVAYDIANWGLLVSVIGIPFICAFSITFGYISEHPVESYSSALPLLYNMFSMLVVSDHDFESLEKANPTMARVLCGSYIGIMAIVCLNILIALLSDTFSRLYSNAVAIATMQRAKTILLIEASLGNKKKHAYEEFITSKCSPETVELRQSISISSEHGNNKSFGILKDYVTDIRTLLNERFGKQYGEGSKSDFDSICGRILDIENLIKQDDIEKKQIRRHLHQTHAILVEIGKSHGIDTEGIKYIETIDPPTHHHEDPSTRISPSMNASRRKSLLQRKEAFDYEDIDENSYFPPKGLSLKDRGKVSGKGIENKGYENGKVNRSGKSGYHSEALNRLDSEAVHVHQSRAQLHAGREQSNKELSQVSSNKSHDGSSTEESSSSSSNEVFRGESREESSGPSDSQKFTMMHKEHFVEKDMKEKYLRKDANMLTQKGSPDRGDETREADFKTQHRKQKSSGIIDGPITSRDRPRGKSRGRSGDHHPTAFSRKRGGDGKHCYANESDDDDDQHRYQRLQDYVRSSNVERRRSSEAERDSKPKPSHRSKNDYSDDPNEIDVKQPSKRRHQSQGPRYAVARSDDEALQNSHKRRSSKHSRDDHFDSISAKSVGF